MYEIQWIIAASVKAAIQSEKYLGLQRLLWDLNLSYATG